MEDGLWALLLLDSQTFGNNKVEKRFFFFSQLPRAVMYLLLPYGNILKIIQIFFIYLGKNMTIECYFNKQI